jgi:hypothetical protein
MPKKAPTGNHVTKNTITLVARIPKAVKAAYEQDAAKLGVPVAELVKGALARDMVRRGWKLEEATKAASGL